MKQIVLILLFLSINYAQNFGNIFSKDSNELSNSQTSLLKDVDLTSLENLTYTPLEQAINPDSYILGPGDLLGINISSIQNVSLPIRINPVGEILIPAVGVINVNNISLSTARKKISDYIIDNAIKNANVNVTLLDIRKFKIQVLGAVHKPGFIYASPIDKIYDALTQSGGVQKFAHPDIVQIIRNGETIDIRLKDYLSGQDRSQNVHLQSGDIINVPFNDYANSIGFNSADYNNHQIVVYGFVNRNNTGNTFVYYPGYTAREYIALAGGTKEQGSSFKAGNTKKAIIHRADGTTIKNALNEIILPGDMIEIPSSKIYQLVGGDGIIRTLASIASSAYIIYRFSQE